MIHVMVKMGISPISKKYADFTNIPTKYGSTINAGSLGCYLQPESWSFFLTTNEIQRVSLEIDAFNKTDGC